MSYYVCLHQEGINSIPGLVKKGLAHNYTVVATSVNPNTLPFDPFEDDPTYPGTLLNAVEWTSRIILILSDVAIDSPNAKVRAQAERILMRDITWAEHLQTNGSVMVRLRGPKNKQLAEIIKGRTKGNWFIQVPITNPELGTFEHRTDATDEEVSQAESIDPWSWWNDFRFEMDHSSKVKVVLDLRDSDRPSRETVRRWLGEPIEAVMIPSSLFVRNRYNYFVLHGEWQVIIGHFIAARAKIIVSVNPTDKSLLQYADYMNKLINDNCDSHNLNSYENALEIPLQPLCDNLDCWTYEIFEKDPVKYKLYQEAIQKALLECVTDEEADKKLTVVMVLGGGRGPLARAVFNAADLTKRKVRVYIIEKNVCAIRTLSNMVKTLWPKKDVHIFSKDMRHFSPPELADILVSELLGSFGDNELSPECLDGAAKLLKPNGISIPCKSTSYINPLMSAVLHNNVEQFSGVVSAFNYGYVALLKSIYHIAEPQTLFEFTHPNRTDQIDNSRYKELSFTVSKDCVLHGIGGYFDTVLYENIILSINPLTHTEGMFSWFPMFFPTHPHTVKAGDTISIKFWRRVDAEKVWYEWQVCSPFEGCVHNVDGTGYNMRL
ncbi:protein arginine N-methyltransferase 5 [Scaptodrosophila lebanonensis]|uniref:Protein arginine N-methyltransferase n=1 Tax=Drosophila lebanonensis TaxID=7225 RepID=A0A6J2T1E2_DROLE|nr:protein arginine N-methyltransferase 5 [Scaptodrosophila lebanonensis]